jgi:urease accessory protein
VLEGHRLVGVETGSCPHAAVREDPSLNLAVLAELEAAYPDADTVLLESGGDNLTLTFSPELVDHSLYVIDVAGGDKIPRKRGPGLILADLLVINKTDLAPYVGADLAVMDRDARLVRGDGPFLFTDCRSGIGIAAVVDQLLGARMAYLAGDRRRIADDDRVHAHTH